MLLKSKEYSCRLAGDPVGLFYTQQGFLREYGGYYYEFGTLCH